MMETSQAADHQELEIVKLRHVRTAWVTTTIVLQIQKLQSLRMMETSQAADHQELEIVKLRVVQLNNGLERVELLELAQLQLRQQCLELFSHQVVSEGCHKRFAGIAVNAQLQGPDHVVGCVVWRLQQGRRVNWRGLDC